MKRTRLQVRTWPELHEQETEPCLFLGVKVLEELKILARIARPRCASKDIELNPDYGSRN